MNPENNENDSKRGRISCLSHVRGQPHVVDLLGTQLKAYFNSRSDNSQRRPTLGPVILSGPPGTGKTMIAWVIHKELGNLKYIEKTGVILNQKQELYSILINADEHTTLFIDEAHGLKSDAQYILLTALSEHHVCIPSGFSSRIVNNIPLANFTMILATTEEYLLQDPLRSRMRICCQFEYYSKEDLAEIVRQEARIQGWQFQSNEIPMMIARRAKGTPRQALDRTLHMCWCEAKSEDRDVITLDDAYRAFTQLRIDEEGLDKRDRFYLEILLKQNLTPLSVISAKLGLPPQTIQRAVEPYLIQAGFVTKGRSSHRVITEKGLNHMNNTSSKSGL
jgi:Holliday junction DNA helicase RuvB